MPAMLLSLRFTVVFAFALVAIAAFGSGHRAFAADFTVTKTADTADGTCDADCSLREAVIAANGAAGNDTITVPSGTFSLTIAGGGENNAATGDLDISFDALTINGGGLANTTIEVGAGDDRVFEIVSGSATIADLEIRNGRGDSGFGCECGGGILVRSGANLTLVNTGVGGNTATGGGLSAGGGTQNDGTLTLTNSFVSGNTADFAGGINNGAGAFLIMNGGAVEQNTAVTNVGGIELPPGSTSTITSALISRNTAAGIGGIDVSGTLTLRDSIVNQNTATGGNSGGLEVSGGALTVVLSTIVNNTASGDGGAIFSNGDVTLTNSTITGNTAGGLGGAILNNVVANLTSTNTTIAGSSPDGIHNFGTAALKNTIVANSTGAECAGAAAVISSGHNLASDNSCGLGGAGDVPNRDPMLGALASNGGPTQTHALLAGSPAIDAGDNAGCPATDQRGFAPPADGDGNGSAVCDIGAYEAGIVAQTTAPTPSPTQVPADLPALGGSMGGRSGMHWLLATARILGIAVAGVTAVRMLRHM